MKSSKFQNRVDWIITLVPLSIIVILCLMLMFFPGASGLVIASLRNVFVGKLGSVYMLFGLTIFLMTVWLAFSKFGSVKLGDTEKPRFGFFTWGAMIFTSTMAADILYWSLIEWAYYFSASPFAQQNLSLVQRQDYASAYPLFHWGPIPWSFYILPAVAYGYMFFVKNRTRQTLSEACRSTIGCKADALLGRTIDIFAIVGLLAGTATTFALATPLLAKAVSITTGMAQSTLLIIAILGIIALVYTVAVLVGIKGISNLANLCVALFLVLVLIFLVFGPSIYIVESGLTGIGKMIQEFFSMATWMDPLRLSSEAGSGFPQDWTVFYWAYWIAWFVATPFFIGKISEGRTIRQTIVGGMFCGLLGTYTSFIVFGNFGLFQQVTGKIDAAGMLLQGFSPSEVIVALFAQLPIPGVALTVLALAMVAFYASTFDAITLVVAEYSMIGTQANQDPPKWLRVFWAVVFIVLPIGLIFSESTLRMLQTISIVAAFPLAVIMAVVIGSFLKDLIADTERV